MGDFVTYGLNPWRESVAMHAGWWLVWVSLFGAVGFLVVHALYVRYWPKPQERVAPADVAPLVAGRVPARVPRHSLGARLFHWVMAAAMLVLLVTGFLPILGVQFEWVVIHWIAGLVLTASILFHLVHASVVLDFWSIWPTPADLKDANMRFRRSLGEALPEPRRPGKYPLDNKLYHLALVVTGLVVAGTGLFMMKRIQTPLFKRDPYAFGDMTWGLLYVSHGLAGIALVGLTIAHIYFAIRPEKLAITYSMIFGWMDREYYLEHHDPDRWRVSDVLSEAPKSRL
jgi:cytochrome b subunit of formate dehydrogenase